MEETYKAAAEVLQDELNRLKQLQRTKQITWMHYVKETRRSAEALHWHMQKLEEYAIARWRADRDAEDKQLLLF